MDDDKREIIEQMLEVAHPPREQGWYEAGKLGIDNEVTVFDLLDSATDETWEMRAEDLEERMYLLNAMYLIQAGKLKEKK